MLQRLERMKDGWLISGLRPVYIHDLIIPLNPSLVPQIDPAAVTSFRPAYRYLSYLLSQRGHPTRDDLPGMDKPETVNNLIDADEAWLRDRV
jgi:hypothetical protein